MLEVQIDPQVEAVAAGKHRDPFSFLGPHEETVRAWLPQAREVQLVDCDDSLAPMQQGPTGFFSVTLPEPSRDYRFRLILYSGESVDLDDPYRFPPLLTAFDLHLHGEGSNYESYRTMGAHVVEFQGVTGVRFAVWAPNAEVVSVTGDFNGWNRTRHPMWQRDGGVWEIFIPARPRGALQVLVLALAPCRNTAIRTAFSRRCLRAPRPSYGPINYTWGDSAWMERRGHERNMLREPVSIYEVHLESWLRGAADECAGIPRGGPQAFRLRDAHGLHPYRADAGDGAPVSPARGAIR